MQIAQLSPVVARSSEGIEALSSSSSGSADKVLSRCLDDDATGSRFSGSIGAFSEISDSEGCSGSGSKDSETAAGATSGCSETGVCGRDGEGEPGVDVGGLLTG